MSQRLSTQALTAYKGLPPDYRYTERLRRKYNPTQVLSGRQLQIVQLLSEGEITKSIARKLGIKNNTVKNHLTSIFDVLGVRTAAGVVGIAFRAGWLK